MEILVTNDDGIRAEGISVLADTVRDFGEVTVVAPSDQQSATSHAITLHMPLRIEEVELKRHAVSGTPTDCVLLSVNGLLDARPDIVISGVNHGPNMGADVTYSGTVAAAVEGTLLGVPSLALSLAGRSELHFETPRHFIPIILRKFLEEPPPPLTYWNVNFPNIPPDDVRGIAVTQLGTRVYQDTVVRKVDPRGKPYYWIGGDEPTADLDQGTDFRALHDGYISITPLHLELNDFKSIARMRTWSWGVGGDKNA